MKRSRFLGLVAGVPARDEPDPHHDLLKAQASQLDSYRREMEREKCRRMSSALHALTGLMDKKPSA